MLKPIEQRFVNIFVEKGRGWSAEAVAKEAGFTKFAYYRAQELLERQDIQDAIEARYKEIEVAIRISVEATLAQWVAVATADPSELTQLRRVNCRYCHGVGHRYSWTPAEFEAAAVKAIKEGCEMPDGSGGIAFEKWAAPDPDCPECQGHGIMEPWFADTRDLSPQARLLFNGVKTRKNGEYEILLRDRDAALANIAKYLGMFNDKTVPVEKDCGTVEILSDEELLRIANS